MLSILSLALLAGALFSPLASAAAALEGRGEDGYISYGGSSGGPNWNIGPHQPHRPIPKSPPRTRTCVVKANGGGKDDSDNILAAIHSCNNGGRVLFSKDQHYTIGTALDLTFLNHIDLDIQGYITFTNDTTYWQAAAFKQIFQNATTFFQLGGTDVNVYGGGTLDGNGQVWYDLYARNPLILRPVLFGPVRLRGGSITNLNLVQSPQYHFFVHNCTDVLFSDLYIASASHSNNTAKNTDGWDTYRSSNIVIQNSRIFNGDDCVSFKPNSTEILVQNLWCNGSHGISVGSLGQYPTETDIVENVYVYNISMNNASDGARIKVWPGVQSAQSADLQGGGGSGYVKNITYEGMVVNNVDYAIEITQCYGQKNLTLCNEFPSSLTISDVLMKDFSGTTSKKFQPVIGYLVCSSDKACSDITVEDISVRSPNGSALFTCGTIPTSGFHGITCAPENLGQN